MPNTSSLLKFKNVWVLAIAQSLLMTIGPVTVFIGGILGTELAPSKSLSTLPITSMIVGTAAFVLPVTFLMRRFSRKAVFLMVSILAICLSFLVGWAVEMKSFWLLCLGIFSFGLVNACAIQFRFAAVESVPKELIPKAASFILIGGIISAFIGPELALLGKDLLSVDYVGSFYLMSILFVIAFGVLWLFKDLPVKNTEIERPSRPLSEIIKQQKFWIAILSGILGYAIMSFIMTATPVSMHIMDGFDLTQTKRVIQSHILAMFLPSLITGQIIHKIGLKKVILIGLLLYIICIVLAFLGHSLFNYYSSLILLGIGWNFLFIAGTTLLPQTYNEGEKFKMQAINDFSIFGIQALASLSAGWLVHIIGWETLVISILPIILFYTAFVVNRFKN